MAFFLALTFRSASWAQDEPTPDPGDAGALDATPGPDQTATVAGQPLVASAGNPFGFVMADSELVYGPSLYGFDTTAFVDAHAGFLATFFETVGTERLRGPEIVQRVAEEYSVGPRVLLALLELSSAWVTDAAPAERSAPLGGETVGLEAGLAAAADALSGAYYARKLAGETALPLADGTIASLPDVNAGTFAVMAYLGARTAPDAWAGLELPSRFVLTWQRLFGDPIAFDIAALRPVRTAGPALVAPIPPAELWYYVRGPHRPAGSGTPWAAIDFAPPPPEDAACAPSASWVTAVASGTVVISRAGNLVLDLDDDRFAGSGWAHVYRHLWVGELAPVGRFVRVGERLGHPSCDGGAAAPARVSLARTFDGEWIGVGDPISPLLLGSWIAAPGAIEGAGPLLGSGFAPRQPSPVKQPAANGVFISP